MQNKPKTEAEISGTTITTKDIRDAWEQLFNMPIPKETIMSPDEFKARYNEPKKLMDEYFEKAKYKAMWEQLKREFPFNNKM